MIPVETFIPTLQLAVSPVILISAVGLLILTINNRMAHSVDRARKLTHEKESASAEIRTKISGQIKIIYRRLRIIRSAMVLILSSALASALLIISLFITALIGWQVIWLYITMFAIALSCLIGGLILFIYDVNNGLEALRIELGEWE